MVARGVRGWIVCTASVAAHQAGYGLPTYTASKHALLGLVRVAAANLGRHGVRVNCVSPFMVATGMTTSESVTVEMLENICSVLSNLKGAVLTASHVAEAAMFLASEESGFVSGHDLVVNGGTSVTYSCVSKITEHLGNVGSSNL